LIAGTLPSGVGMDVGLTAWLSWILYQIAREKMASLLSLQIFSTCPMALGWKQTGADSCQFKVVQWLHFSEPGIFHQFIGKTRYGCLCACLIQFVSFQRKYLIHDIDRFGLFEGVVRLTTPTILISFGMVTGAKLRTLICTSSVEEQE
jgi:hypothetical protein